MEGYDSKFDRKKYSSNRVRALSRTLTFQTISEQPTKVNPILLPNSTSFRRFGYRGTQDNPADAGTVFQFSPTTA